MPEGICPKCGACYHGWALLSPRHQTCSRCGTALEITGLGGTVFKGYSPFTAEKLVITPPPEVSPHEKEKDKKKSKKRPPT